MVKALFGGYARGYALLAALAVLSILLSYFLFGRSIEDFRILPGKDLLVLLVAPFLLSLASLVLKLMRRRSEHPGKVILRVFRRQKFWVARTFIALTIYFIVTQGFGAFKPRISLIQPFYADRYIADFENALFFGTDPWRLTHGIFGNFGTLVLDRIYMLFFVFVGLSIVVMATARDHAFQLRALLTAFSIWIVLGVILAIALSSVGPVFYEQYYGSDRFAPLVARLRDVDASTPLSMIMIADWLVTQADRGTFGSGISAMPSLHVAHTYFFLLITRHLTAMLLPRILMLVFFLAIWIGSVHLAWHYALDGLVSVICVSFFWYGSGKLVAWLGPDSHPATQVAPSPHRGFPTKP